MPKYVIEREIPGAGSLTQEQILGISQKSCSVLKSLGSEIQWVESFVTPDKIYCIYIAPNEQMVREHAKQGGFPANRVSEVKRDDRSDFCGSMIEGARGLLRRSSAHIYRELAARLNVVPFPNSRPAGGNSCCCVSW